MGMATEARIAMRFGLDREAVDDQLLDDEAMGLVNRIAFPETRGWSLTDRGRAEDERRLAMELDACGGRAVVEAGHAAFLPLNAQLLDAMTRWQLRPTPWDAMAANDHTDWPWDERVLADLRRLLTGLRAIEASLTSALTRFGGYALRFEAALARVDQGQRRWVDAPGIDSCHHVWVELHEDLVSTLGITRGA